MCKQNKIRKRDKEGSIELNPSSHAWNKLTCNCHIFLLSTYELLPHTSKGELPSTHWLLMLCSCSRGSLFHREGKFLMTVINSSLSKVTKLSMPMSFSVILHTQILTQKNTNVGQTLHEQSWANFFRYRMISLYGRVNVSVNVISIIWVHRQYDDTDGKCLLTTGNTIHRKGPDMWMTV